MKPHLTQTTIPQVIPIMASVEELTALIVTKGNEIRELKTAKAPKDKIEAAVADLLSLKEKYKEANGGVAYEPPKAEAPKVEKPKPVPAQPPVEKEGPSKKELNKLARKEKRHAHKDDEPPEETTIAASLTSPTSANVDGTSSLQLAVSTPPVPKPIATASKLSNGVYVSPTFSSPDVSRILCVLLHDNIPFFTSPSTEPHLPYLSPPSSQFKPQHVGASSISGDANIARYLCRSVNSPLYATTDPWLASEIDQWLDLYTSRTSNVGPINPATALAKLLPVVEGHMSDKTYAVGGSLTLADIALFTLLNRAEFAPSELTPNSSRYYTLLQSTLPSPAPLSSKDTKLETAKGVMKPKEGTPSSSGCNSGVAGNAGNAAEEDGGTCPPLEDAEDGKVCTRFPPEPSGYLHIGHAKAVLLNQYYAQRYKGRLLVRFDDTNPSKEKEEYADNILQDLDTLGVKPDAVSHTSDHFALCEDLARRMIKDGTAYMDDTDQETMQAERMKMVESVRRNTSVEENLSLFESLLKGEVAAQKFCLRAKIDMSSVNGTMRDPVLYRFNENPHHRTGTKFKAYPTYDFACPIVDSIEGVTHALRTTEYNDRDEQYYWLQQAMGLRPVKIYSYGKINFVHTVLSKRKLNWFVEQKMVSGWNDPRFPTIQGCIRRGVNVEALKGFILGQGASKRIITMEWDKFWSENKKVLEERCARYMGVVTEDAVPVTVTNAPIEVEAVSVQVHPSKPELGQRVMRRWYKLTVEQVDAQTFTVGEEVTFVRWGNIRLDKIEKDPSTGKVTSIEGRYDAESTNFKKTVKTTWLAAVPELVPCRLVEFDYLISKAKLGDDEDFKDFVNKNSSKETLALCDPCLRLLPAGEVIQLERKGFYRIDEAYGGDGKPAVLFAIPDGRVVKTTVTNVEAKVTTGKKK